MMRRLRRLMILALLAGAVAWCWRRARPDTHTQPHPTQVGAEPVVAPAPTPTDDHPTQVGAEPVVAPAPTPTDDSGGAVLRWVTPVAGQCPDGYPVKANDNSGIYHVPGGRFYGRTIPERCYAVAAEAEADGYRRAKA